MIKIENVSFSYEGNTRECLENTNLNINKGECILLCGRSGCGKTTFTRLLNGIIPHFFSGKLTGRVLVKDIDISETPMYVIANHVGSVFQNPRTQFFNMDTDSEIAFGLENRALPILEMHQRVAQVKKDLGIENLSNRNIFELSGGEKQKIAIASIYAMNPDIYILDEPSSSLDMNTIMELKRVLFTLKQQNKTVLVAEHRFYYLMDVIDRAFYFESGKLTNIFSPHELCLLSQQEREKMGLRAIDLNSVKPKNYSCDKHTTLLELKNITLKHKNKKILEDINLSINAGEVIGVIGHNGAGKTTFLRTLCGLHKEMEGHIFLNGVLQKHSALMKQSYLVMQDVDYELFAESVEKECTLGIKEPDISLVNSTLEELKLTQFRKSHPNTLSGGQKQRLAIAVSIICKKNLLIFDEPTSGLDYDNMLCVAQLIRRLALMGKMIFIATHDYEFVCETCTRVVYFDEKKQKEDMLVCSENEINLRKLFQGSVYKKFDNR